VPAGEGPKCAAHRKQLERERSQRRRANPNDQIHFHNSQQWRIIRAAHLASSPLCVLCQEKGFVTAAGVVDHIKAIADGGDPIAGDNLQSLCKTCHDSKTWTELNRRRWGSK
jgi:5-methylcytosine-specific restriction protein A